jgi:DNA mismatch endonuclease, patch repair protein
VVDVYTKTKRSEIMSRIRSRDTTPENQVNLLLRSSRILVRRNDKTLPGSPDFVLPSSKIVFLVNGCFWHGHPNCTRAKLPSSNRSFWRSKIDRNQLRDRRQIRTLRKMGWSVILLWTCRKLSASNILGRMKAVIRRRKHLPPRRSSSDDPRQTRGSTIAETGGAPRIPRGDRSATPSAHSNTSR